MKVTAAVRSRGCVGSVAIRRHQSDTGYVVICGRLERKARDFLFGYLQSKLFG